MLHKMGAFTGSTRKVSPPTPTYMNEDQKCKSCSPQQLWNASQKPSMESKLTSPASYLSSLRNNKPARPTGSRPPPFKSSTYNAAPRPTGPLARSDSAPVLETFPPRADKQELGSGHPGMPKSTSFSQSVFPKGRPLAQAPTACSPSLRGRNVSPTATIQQQETLPDDYRGSTTRRLEKEEASTLRQALHIIDHGSEEETIYETAKMEAADLVWKHRNPKAADEEKTAPYFNPDLPGEKSYGAQGRQQAKRDVSDGSYSSQDSHALGRPRSTSTTKGRALSQALKDLQLASEERAASILAVARSERRRSSGTRITSNGSSRSLFMNPGDQIYEEPGSLERPMALRSQSELPLKSRHRNSLPRGSRPLPDKPGLATPNTAPRVNRIDIYKNPPTQSRNAAYTSTPPGRVLREDVIEEVDTPKSNTNLEIRGDDIRAATSMKKSDRSPKLPTPTAVSDRPGRPIVSFDRNWKPLGDSPRNSNEISRPVIKLTDSPRASKDFQRPLPRPFPSISGPANSAPEVPTSSLQSDRVSVPTINFPGDDAGLPTIDVQDDSAPDISVSAPSDPTCDHPKSKPATRPLPKHSATTPTKLPSTKTSRLPWLKGNTSNVPTVTCSSCILSISGRIVTASGSSTASSSLRARFHPECFTCDHCSTPLECVSFYPEPDNRRAERLEADRIVAGSPEADMDVRFYCHLDFHELFSPRCRSCKTPIEGQVIVAAGGEYHVGHFFCSECGDPFDSDTPFVEHNNYAYCVRCHTRRTSARCRACKQQILDELTVEALGGKWHERCFNCVECSGGFGEHGRFFVRDVQIEPTEKERRRGINRKVEEMAVCQDCEETRLKA